MPGNVGLQDLTPFTLDGRSEGRWLQEFAQPVRACPRYQTPRLPVPDGSRLFHIHDNETWLPPSGVIRPLCWGQALSGKTDSDSTMNKSILRPDPTACFKIVLAHHVDKSLSPNALSNSSLFFLGRT